MNRIKSNDEIINNYYIKEYTVITSFTSKQKSYSFTIPSNWKFIQLKKFIISTFDSDIGSSTPRFLYQGKTTTDSALNKPINEIFKNNKIVQLIIILNQNNISSNSGENNNNDNNNKYIKNNQHKNKSELFSKSKSDALATSEFNILEKKIMKNYFKSIEQLRMKNEYLYPNNKRKMTNIKAFPLMNYSIADRMDALANKNNYLNKLSSFEPGKIENFPLQNYFDIFLIIKIIFSIALFKFTLDSKKLKIFIAFLICYYWYTIYCIISSFYEKKIDEIKLTDSEIQEIKNIPNRDVTIDEFNKYINDTIKFESVKNDDKNKSNKNDIKDLKNEEDKKIDDNINNLNKKIDNIINNNNINNNNTNNSNNNNNINNNNHLHSILEKENTRLKNSTKNLGKKIQMEDDNKNKKDGKKDEEGDDNNENILIIILTILYTYFISMVPKWSDDFERDNPFPSENSNSTTNNNADNNNNEQQNNNEINTNNNNNNPQNENEDHKDTSKDETSFSKHVHFDNEDLSKNFKSNMNKLTKNINNQNKHETEFEFNENENFDLISCNTDFNNSEKGKDINSESEDNDKEKDSNINETPQKKKSKSQLNK